MLGRDAAARAVRDEASLGHGQQRVMRIEIGGLGVEGLVGRDDGQVGIIGEAQEMGFPRQYDHPDVRDAMKKVADTCVRHGVPVGNPHTNAGNLERLLSEGYRWLMAAPQRSYGVVGKGKELAGY